MSARVHFIVSFASFKASVETCNLSRFHQKLYRDGVTPKKQQRPESTADFFLHSRKHSSASFISL